MLTKRNGPGNENRAERIFNEVISSGDYVVVGIPNVIGDTQLEYPTRSNGESHKAGSPNVIFCHKKIHHKIEDWSTGDDIGSDHVPIMFSIKTSTAKQIYRHQHWAYKRCDKVKMNEIIQKELTKWKLTCNTIKELDNCYGDLLDIIFRGASEACPRNQRVEGHKGNPWWNTLCMKDVKI
jgi:hypothetical protein